jgi:hypothetical protein
MKPAMRTVPWVIAPLILLAACAVARNHTSDATLEQVFYKHEAEFEALLADVQTDSQLVTVQPSTLIYAGGRAEVTGADLSEIEHLGMPKERWLVYQKQLKDLGLHGGVFKGDGGSNSESIPDPF